MSKLAGCRGSPHNDHVGLMNGRRARRRQDGLNYERVELAEALDELAEARAACTMI